MAKAYDRIPDHLDPGGNPTAFCYSARSVPSLIFVSTPSSSLKR